MSGGLSDEDLKLLISVGADIKEVRAALDDAVIHANSAGSQIGSAISRNLISGMSEAGRAQQNFTRDLIAGMSQVGQKQMEEQRKLAAAAEANLQRRQAVDRALGRVPSELASMLGVGVGAVGLVEFARGANQFAATLIGQQNTRLRNLGNRLGNYAEQISRMENETEAAEQIPFVGPVLSFTGMTAPRKARQKAERERRELLQEAVGTVAPGVAQRAEFAGADRKAVEGLQYIQATQDEIRKTEMLRDIEFTLAQGKGDRAQLEATRRTLAAADFRLSADHASQLRRELNLSSGAGLAARPVFQGGFEQYMNLLQRQSLEAGTGAAMAGRVTQQDLPSSAAKPNATDSFWDTSIGRALLFVGAPGISMTRDLFRMFQAEDTGVERTQPPPNNGRPPEGV